VTAQQPRGFEVDDELELGRLHDRRSSDTSADAPLTNPTTGNAGRCASRRFRTIPARGVINDAQGTMRSISRWVMVRLRSTGLSASNGASDRNYIFDGRKIERSCGETNQDKYDEPDRDSRSMIASGLGSVSDTHFH
jgi:hypothetical protein